jgi:hypothetical protein
LTTDWYYAFIEVCQSYGAEIKIILALKIHKRLIITHNIKYFYNNSFLQTQRIDVTDLSVNNILHTKILKLKKKTLTVIQSRSFLRPYK